MNDNVKIIKENLEWVARADGIQSVRTFDKKLAAKLANVSSAAVDALSYMKSREAK